MAKAAKTMEVQVKRTLATTPETAFAAWLDPKVPGNPWHLADKFVLDARLDGLFYSSLEGTSHYGRFTKVAAPKTLQHTWVSPYTEGEESLVTVSFKKQGNDTVMTLTHSGLPNNAKGKAHEDGWNYVLEDFPKHFVKAKKK